MFILPVLYFVISIILYIIFGYQGNYESILKYQEINATIVNLCYTFSTVLIGWIALKYNQPLMKRQDAMTGENVSMLVFIRSKVDLKQIFDTDDYTSDTESI
jgi:hypothetical protein